MHVKYETRSSFVSVSLFAMSLLAIVQAPVAASVPGYEVIPITDNPWLEQSAGLNNCGQIVYGLRHNNVYDSEEVYMYENGVTIRLTDDDVNDRMPDINDAGAVVWMRTVGPSDTGEIVTWVDGDLGFLTCDDLDDYTPFINAAGHVAWTKYTDQGCAGADAVAMFYDGATIFGIAGGAYSNAVNGLNDVDEVIWARYDFCQSPWASDIELYSGGQIATLTHDELEPQIPAIAFNQLTGLTHATWQSEHPDTSHFTRVWDRTSGPTTIADPGGGPRINNYGEVAMGAPGQGVHAGWQVWVYRSANGTYTQVTDELGSCAPQDINDYGEITVVCGTSAFETDVFFFRRIRSGDVDLDFDVDLDDYFAWSDCWTGPLETDGLCHCRFMDMQHDRDIDMADFAAFQNAFGQPVD